MKMNRKTGTVTMIIAVIMMLSCRIEGELHVIKVTDVSLNMAALTLGAGNKETLAATVLPSNATNREVTWSSNNTGVATVSASGEVTGVSGGTASITVTTKDGAKTANCTVTVTSAPTLTTNAVTSFSATSATLGGNITNAGSPAYTERGVVWATTQNPTIANNRRVVTGSGLGSFSIIVDGLTANTTYYVRAYAINGATPTYGAQESFITKEETGQITMTTSKSGEMSIVLRGTGTATVDWGNGTKDEKNLLANTSTSYTHNYTNTNARIITITGNNITFFECRSQQLTSLNVSNNTALTSLDCSYNKLKSLDVSKNTALTYLECSENFEHLTNLDVSKNTALTRLYCSNNQLTSLDVSNNTALTWLFAAFNRLMVLDVRANTKLNTLSCCGNQLESLDVSKNIVLTWLDCSSNQITSLNLSTNTALTTLYVRGNELAASALNSLFGTLHSNTGSKNIYILNNPGTATCDRSLATSRGWTVNE